MTNMSDHKIPSNSMIDWISDDIALLRERPKKSKEPDDGFYSPFKQAHDARLLIVFGHAMIEGYMKYVSSRINIPQSTNTVEFIRHLKYPPELLTVGSLSRLEVILKGIRELRNIIAHSLTDETAHGVDKKIKYITNAGLPVDPTKLNENHFNIILEAFNNVINILGSGLVIHNKLK